jgi:hypothetical protein
MPDSSGIFLDKKVDIGYPSCYIHIIDSNTEALMIIKNATDNQPILSNVGQVGEFRIRNKHRPIQIV